MKTIIEELENVRYHLVAGKHKDVIDDAINIINKLYIKYGYWKTYVDEYEICATEFTCSVCNESFASSDLTDKQFFEMMKYCPNCGAKMKGVKE